MVTSVENDDLELWRNSVDDFWSRLDEAVKDYPSKKALCEEVGISPNSFSNWRKRKTYPSALVLIKICEIVGVPPESLLRGPMSGVPLSAFRGRPDMQAETQLARRVEGYQHLMRRYRVASKEWESDTQDVRGLQMPRKVERWVNNNKDVIGYMMALRKPQADLMRVVLRALAGMENSGTASLPASEKATPASEQPGQEESLNQPIHKPLDK